MIVYLSFCMIFGNKILMSGLIILKILTDICRLTNFKKFMKEMFIWKILEMILDKIYIILILINSLWVEIVLVWLSLELYYYNQLMKMQFLKYIVLNVITQVENMLINLDIFLILKKVKLLQLKND